jgi:hypothetical protein
MRLLLLDEGVSELQDGKLRSHRAGRTGELTGATDEQRFKASTVSDGKISIGRKATLRKHFGSPARHKPEKGVERDLQQRSG